MDGVDSVKVTLNDGKAIVALKPLNKVTLAQMRAVIEKNGFTPKAATIAATADVVAGPSGQPQLRLTGTNETFPVSSATGEAVRTDLKKHLGTRVSVQGVVPPLKENPGGAIDVKEVRPAVP